MIKIRIDKAKRCRNEYSLFISFPYDISLINTLRAYSTRYWNPDTKEWELPEKNLDYIKHDFKDCDLTIEDKRTNTHGDSKNVSTSLKTMSVSESDYKFKTNSFKHQIEGVNYGLSHNKWLLGDEQGLGKTKQAIDIACIKKETNNFKHCLIICGVNGLKWNWQNEVAKHSFETAHILGQRINKKGNLIIKSMKERLDDLNNIDDIKEYFLITNIETLRNTQITNKLAQLCNNGTIEMIVADECHKMKNPTSVQGKAFLKLNAKYQLAITGTPMMNTPLDLYIILRWLGYDRQSFGTFKNHYCVFGGYGGYEIIGYKNLGRIQATLDSMMLRRLKSEVLDLPDKLYVDEYVDMTPKQEQIYKEVLMQVRANIDKIKLSPNPLTELIRLRQVTGYTGIVSSNIQESAKLDRMEELVEDAISNNRKVVIFSNWTNITHEVVNRLSRKYKGVAITGETQDEERMNSVNSFQNDDDCKFIVGTIGAMGTGLTLTAGTVEIFLDEPWNRALFDQAVDRCHRIGAKDNVTVYVIMCKNTLDEKIHSLVQKKGAMSDFVVDGKQKNELLNYLLNEQ